MVPGKVERWTDLLAFLSRHNAATRTEILEGVPGYLAGMGQAVGGDVASGTVAVESARRKFERDKDALRALGLSLETVPLAAVRGRQAQYGYRLDPPVAHAVRVLIAPDPAPPESEAERVLSWDEVRTVERALFALDGRVSALAVVGRSVRHRLTQVPATDDPAAGTEVNLRPEELLALQVALVLHPDGQDIARRFAGEE